MVTTNNEYLSRTHNIYRTNTIISCAMSNFSRFKKNGGKRVIFSMQKGILINKMK